MNRDHDPRATDQLEAIEPKRFRVSRRRLVGSAAGGAAALSLGAGWPRLAGAGPAPAGHAGRRAAQADEPTIVIGTLGEASSINPFAVNESEGYWRCKMLFDEFVRANAATYAPEPGLASEWTIEDLVFTFTVRDNATFADGTDVTAEDVAFTLKGMLAAETASPSQIKYMAIDGAEAFAAGDADDVSGIEVVDPKTLKITLARPDAPFLYNLRYLFVVPAAMLEGKDISNTSTEAFFQSPVGAGPFVFESWETGGDFVATRNENYWQEGKPALASFTHRVIADSQSLVLALQNDEIDASNYPNPAAKEQLEENPELTILVPPFASPNGWMFNLANEHLAKKEVRQAIAMALNTDQFASDFLLGLSRAGLGPIAPDSWAHDPDLEPIPYDVEAARQMVIDAGSEGAQIRFNVNKGNVLREDWLTYTQQALEEIGIEVVAELLEYATLVDQVTINKDYDVTGVDFAGVTAEPSELFEQFHSESSGNYMNYSNPELDALLVQAKETLEIEDAKPIYAEIQRILIEDVPMFFAWYRPFLHAVENTYTGYTDSAAYGLFHTLEDWTVTE
ncbi:MAG: ABC transporter substrate-binding protein [Chloroflexia bacterium]|nr:ABC transporter substrate-binding protein [Chloroflexia bacterium]